MFVWVDGVVLRVCVGCPSCLCGLMELSVHCVDPLAMVLGSFKVRRGSLAYFVVLSSWYVLAFNAFEQENSPLLRLQKQPSLMSGNQEHANHSLHAGGRA